MRSEQIKSTKEALLQQIKAECGIDLIGITDPEAFSTFGKKVSESYGSAPLAFSKGDITERFDVAGEWEDARGIISFAVSYAASEKGPKAPGTMRVCKASWGEDYHNVLKEKAEELMERFSSVYKCGWKIFVDTGKLSDRACAWAAGLGFYGRNGFIISPEYGSFISLGHILTDIPLESSAVPLEPLCGECTRCIKACPGGALGKEKWVDYSSCVSWLTQKGKEYERTDYVYGCDICQDVCPFNENVPEDLHCEYSFPQELRFPDPGRILEMDEAEFEALYGKSALAWRGLGTMKKNARRFLQRKNRE